MIFYGFYEGFKSMNFPGGVAGSSSALLAMTMTYPVDVLKTRVQAGETVASARGMGSFGRGLNWAVAKCLVSNFVALSVSRLASPHPTLSLGIIHLRCHLPAPVSGCPLSMRRWIRVPRSP
jgi:hypothetical protein